MEIALLHEGYLVIVFDFDNCLQSVLGYLFCLLCWLQFSMEKPQILMSNSSN